MDLNPTAEIALEFPVKLDGTTYSSLTMRRPKVKDNLWFEKQPGGEFQKVVNMCARLCDVPPEVIAELDEIDMKKLDDQYGSFRGVGGDA